MMSIDFPITETVVSENPVIQVKAKSSWFVFYTYPRSEKVVYRELLKMNYEVFLPMTKTMRVWKNRQKKWVQQVLFPNYIFVNTRQCDLHFINQVPKIVTYIQCAGKPSVVSTKEIETIKKMLFLKEDISVVSTFYKGEKVKIVSGPLIGHEGILIKQSGKTRFGIELKEINQTILIDIDTNVLEKA